MNTNFNKINLSDKAFRKTSVIAGVLYLLTFISIPTLSLYNEVKGANYVINSSSNSSALTGGLLEIIVALAGIASAIVLFPVLKKENETMALGLVAARILEAATIFVGVAFILSIVTLQQEAAGESALVISHTLATLYNRIFLLGQSFIPAICDLLLGFLLYRSRLVPKAIAIIGIFGAPILVVGYIAVFTGLVERLDTFPLLSAVPVALFEFSLGIWLIFKGFNTELIDSKVN